MGALDMGVSLVDFSLCVFLVSSSGWAMCCVWAGVGGA